MPSVSNLCSQSKRPLPLGAAETLRRYSLLVKGFWAPVFFAPGPAGHETEPRPATFSMERGHPPVQRRSRRAGYHQGVSPRLKCRWERVLQREGGSGTLDECGAVGLLLAI